MLTLLNRDPWFSLTRFMSSDFFDDRAPQQDYQPPYEVEETEDHYFVSIDIPGVPKDKIQLEAKDGVLRMSAEKRERKWSRAFTLPKGAEATRIEASVKDGVLRIAVPKVEAAKPHSIPIQDGRSGVFQQPSGTKEEKEVEKSA